MIQRYAIVVWVFFCAVDRIFAWPLDSASLNWQGACGGVRWIPDDWGGIQPVRTVRVFLATALYRSGAMGDTAMLFCTIPCF